MKTSDARRPTALRNPPRDRDVGFERINDRVAHDPAGESERDWASQVSTEPSPSAGWGVSQGSIQFFSEAGQGLVLLTLADTGPGRGFDSVGHAAGIY